MMSKIEFRYSNIYDSPYRNSKVMEKFLKKNKLKYPSGKRITNYIKKVSPMWRKVEKEILQNTSKIMNLKWKEKNISCHVVGKTIPFSDPLTIGIVNYPNKNKFINALAHEMIHQIQRQNAKTMQIWWKYAKVKYKKEPRRTINHILVFAVFEKMYLDVFGKRRLNESFKKYAPSKEYSRAIEIMKKESAENIIKKFKELIN